MHKDLQHMTHKINSITIILTLFIIMYLPVFVSYFGDYHIFIFQFIFPVYLFFMFARHIRIKQSHVLILTSYLVLTFFAMVFFYDNSVVDLFHLSSYLMIIIGTYGFAIYVLQRDEHNIKKIFKTILSILFLCLFTEYFFAYLGFDNANYWDFEIYNALNYIHGNPASTLNTFGNIGSGKGVTPSYILLSIVAVSYLYRGSNVRYFLLLSILVYLGMMTYSRAFMLALVVYFLFEISFGSFKRFFKYFLVFFLILIYIIYFYYDFINIFIRIDLGGSENISGKGVDDDPRMKLLLMQIQSIQDKFIFGYGWSGMNQHFIDMFGRSTSGELGMVSYWTEQGILRASYIYALIIISLYKTLKFIKSRENLFKEVYAASLLILVFNFFWGATSVSNTRTVLMWFFIFLVLNIRNKKVIITK